MRYLLYDEDVKALGQLEDALKIAVPRCILHTCSSVPRALACGERFFIDAAFLDINIEASGLTLAKKLQDSQPNMPIVFITDSVQRTTDALPSCITKPASPEDIKQVLAFFHSQRNISRKKHASILS